MRGVRDNSVLHAVKFSIWGGGDRSTASSILANASMLCLTSLALHLCWQLLIGGGQAQFSLDRMGHSSCIMVGDTLM